jgi:type II secretory pathway pseudopilin PulG
VTHIRNTRGFTILELLVAALVAITFGLAGWSFQHTQARELSDQSATIDATDRIRGTMGFVADEIRQAGEDPLLTALLISGQTGIRQARPDRIWIELDADGDGILETDNADPFAESILYAYDAPNRRILRTVAGVTQTLTDDVPPGGFDIEYFDVLGNAIAFSGIPPILNAAERDLVAFVRLNLRVTAQGVHGPNVLELSSRITVRNRVLDRL